MAPEETPVRESDVSAFPVTFDRREGRILFSGVPVWFMTAQYYVDMQVQLESVIGKASKGILYRSAELLGTRLVRLVAGETVADGDDMTRVSALLRVAELLPVLGHGKATLVLEDLHALETTWTLPHSQIAELRRPSSQAVCHFYTGVVAGLVAGAFGRGVRADEVRCRAKGDEACVITTRAA